MSAETGIIAAGERSATKVVIVGAGLVGSLAALYMARLGYNVEVFDKRSGKRSKVRLLTQTLDMRRELVDIQGRSINLALSIRGIEALKVMGLAARVLETAIPMSARMVHDDRGGRGSYTIPYGDFGEVWWA